MDCTLIEHGYLVPVTKEEVLEDGAVAFAGSRIVYVGPTAGFDRAKFAPTRIVDARGKAILPGLVNTHIHLVGGRHRGSLQARVSCRLRAAAR